MIKAFIRNGCLVAAVAAVMAFQPAQAQARDSDRHDGRSDRSSFQRDGHGDHDGFRGRDDFRGHDRFDRGHGSRIVYAPRPVYYTPRPVVYCPRPVVVAPCYPVVAAPVCYAPVHPYGTSTTFVFNID